MAEGGHHVETTSSPLAHAATKRVTPIESAEQPEVVLASSHSLAAAVHDAAPGVPGTQNHDSGVIESDLESVR
eukprot:6202829-Alexandrium_andersonii.AAC.1